MQSKHYINYGTPKTATSWLFTNLGFRGVKEPDLQLVHEGVYQEYFEGQGFSVNFNPNLWQLDSSQLKMLDRVTTHRSIIFRDPYSYANSLYNFWNTEIESLVFLSTFKQYFDYAPILNRLPKTTMVLFYDDIKNNPQSVLDKITDFLEIPKVVSSSEYVNKTTYTKKLNFQQRDIIIMNDFITKFEDLVDQDLSHWKMNV